MCRAGLLWNADLTVNAPKHVPLWLLVLVTLSGTLAVHIFVPALPLAGRDLNAGPAALQLTISLYMFALASSQLVYGPLADRYGRRPVLLTGLSIYTMASVAAALAPTVTVLIVARIFQAIGGCAGLALGRAIVRDLAGPQDAAKRLAMLNMMIMIGPGLAPMFGTLTSEYLGWRAIFVFLALMVSVAIIVSWRILPETNATARELDSRALIRSYFRLIRTRKFFGIAIAGGCSTASMYAFLASSPFVGEEIGISRQQVGFYLVIIMGCVSISSIAVPRLVARFGQEKLFLYSSLLSMIAALVYLVAGMLGRLDATLLVATMATFALGAGVSSPLALSLTMSVNPQLIGSAAGLYGFVQMGIAAICTFLTGFGESPSVMSGLVLFITTVIGQVFYKVAMHSRD